jgi:hypothetical protein
MQLSRQFFSRQILVEENGEMFIKMIIVGQKLHQNILKSKILYYFACCKWRPT